MDALKRAWSGAVDFLNNPPADARSWLKITGMVTLFTLLWGLTVTGIIIRTYSLESPEMNWNLPSAMHLADQMMGALGETAIMQGWIMILAVILSGRKSVRMLLLLSLPINVYYIATHSAWFLGFASQNMAVLWATALQGVLFFVWSLLFIKCVDSKSLFQPKAVLTVALSHFLYNVFIIKLIAFFGQSS